MRMADADVIPYQFTDLAETIHGYVADLKKLALTVRDKAKEQNSEITEGVYKALYDPKKQFVPPSPEPLPPYFNFAPLDQASDDLTRAAEDYDKAMSAAGDNLPPAVNDQVNEQLVQTERMLIDSAGLPNRPWFENLIYAPGFYTGYGVKTMPGVREAIEQKQWSAVNPQIERVASALEREVSLLEKVTKAVQQQLAKGGGMWFTFPCSKTRLDAISCG
jgi:N-acetylated-alpha-linked acidic dipeptidase